MNMVQINSGNFATGEGNKGNYNAYSSKHGRIFIHKRMMEAAGFTKDADVKFPFFIILDTTKEISLVDANGEPTGEKSVRPSAVSVFTNEADMINDFNSDAQFTIKAKVALAATAKTAGLSEEAVKALLAVAI